MYSSYFKHPACRIAMHCRSIIEMAIHMNSDTVDFVLSCMSSLVFLHGQACGKIFVPNKTPYIFWLMQINFQGNCLGLESFGVFVELDPMVRICDCIHILTLDKSNYMYTRELLYFLRPRLFRSFWGVRRSNFGLSLFWTKHHSRPVCFLLHIY